MRIAANSDAGLRYGRDGVCHQMANRILHPASGLTIAGCNGYRASTFRWGAYGKTVWTQLTTCYPVGISIAGGSGASQPQQGNPMTNTGTYGSDGTPIQISGKERISQLDYLIRQATGHSLDPNRFAALVQVQTKLWQADATLDLALERKEIEPDEYLQRMEGAMAEAMNESRTILGARLFDQVFGDAGAYPEGSIDKNAFYLSQI
jgi:hypothetical protein